MNFLMIGSFYVGLVLFMLYFFSASYYNDTPGIAQYDNNIGSFYDKLKDNLSKNDIKVSKIFNKDTMIASAYRHILCRKYLNNAEALSSIGFSNEEITLYQENLIPVYSVRNTMFKQLGTSVCCTIIGIGLMFV